MVYTKKALKASRKKKARERKGAYKPAQKDNILGIAIGSIQKQPNKRDIPRLGYNQPK